MNDRRLLLLDGNSVINRAYFALAGRRPLTAADGTPTGALLGFLNIFLKLSDEMKPTHVCAVFDTKEPTFRHRAYDGYKATRKPMPDDLAIQMPLIKEILQAMGIRTAELAGYEADDIIGTLAARMGAEGIDVAILSGDRDGLQLVDDHVRLILPVTRAGQTTTEVFDRSAVVDKYGVLPEQLIDVKSIMGDASDNIPGVRGIGEKGALELIARYGSLDGVYASLPSIRPNLADKLSASRDTAYLSQNLARICREVPIDVSHEDLKLQSPDAPRLTSLFDRLGLRGVAARLGMQSVTPSTSPAASDSPQPADVLTQAICASCADEVEKLLLSTKSSMIAVYISDNWINLALGERATGRVPLQEAARLFGFLAEQGIMVAGYDLKQDMRRIVAPWHLLQIHDVLVAAYLLSQLDGKPDFDRICETSTGKRPPLSGTSSAAPNPRQGVLFDDMNATGLDGSADDDNPSERLRTLGLHAMSILETAAAQRVLLQDTGMTSLADQVEMPLISVLAEMENTGFQLDREVLDELSGDFLKRISELEKAIHELCGQPFNINSPKQLSEVLFDRLGLPGGKKNASGNYSTDAEELERLAALHPAVMMILEYRQLAKLRSTFVEGLAKVIDPRDGRVHTTFNQNGAATGRLSSTEPNLQNIPIRSAVGREIRKAFVPEPGKVLLDADYSQIELRLLAHLSGDETMVGAFLSGKDIHAITAAKIFDVPENQVTSDMRAAAKTVNFSIAYGVSGFGLARGLGIGVAEAQCYIDEYYAEYPGVRRYLEGLVASAVEKGYTETLYGRRRNIPELKSPNRNIRNFGERIAMNTPVQGTAADIIKMAMIRVNNGFRQAGLQSRLVLQVHDELIVEAPPEEADAAAGILQEGMESVASLRVSLMAEVRRGNNWFNTK